MRSRAPYRFACRDGSAFLAGFCAGASGQSHASANPHATGSEMATAWDDGYIAGWSRRILRTVTHRSATPSRAPEAP